MFYVAFLQLFQCRICVQERLFLSCFCDSAYYMACALFVLAVWVVCVEIVRMHSIWQWRQQCDNYDDLLPAFRFSIHFILFGLFLFYVYVFFILYFSLLHLTCNNQQLNIHTMVSSMESKPKLKQVKWTLGKLIWWFFIAFSNYIQLQNNCRQ